MRLLVILAVLLAASPAFGQTISALPSANTITGNEFVPIVQNGVTVKATVSQFPGGGGGAVTSVFGRTGVVTAHTGDYTCVQVTGCGSVSGVVSIFGRTGVVTASPGDYTCSQVTLCPTSYVSSAFGRTGSVTGQSGDYTCSQVTSCPATGTSGHVLCYLDAQCIWTARQVLNLQTYTGIVSPKVNVGWQLVCEPANPADPECNSVDAFAYSGYPQFTAERYEENGSGGFIGVPNNKPIGCFCFAPYDSASDAVTAGFGAWTAEAQSHVPDHHGTSILITATLNATAALRTPMMFMNPGGLGGVEVGYASFGAAIANDPGTGSLNTQFDLIASQHIRSNGTAPAISSCGSSPSVTGTDNAGYVTTGGSVASCVVTFAASWPSTPVCMVKTDGAATPTAYVSAHSGSAITVSFSSNLNGTFAYMCQGDN
jgi:hypothetical protein